jgi:hypothetical protein
MRSTQTVALGPIATGAILRPNVANVACSLPRPVAIDTPQDVTVKKGLHRPKLNAIIPISRPPALILIAAPFSSRLSRYIGGFDEALNLPVGEIFTTALANCYIY